MFRVKIVHLIDWALIEIDQRLSYEKLWDWDITWSIEYYSKSYKWWLIDAKSFQIKRTWSIKHPLN